MARWRISGAQGVTFRGTVGKIVAGEMRASMQSCAAVTEKEPCRVLAQDAYPRREDNAYTSIYWRCPSVYKMPSSSDLARVTRFLVVKKLMS